jgi:hypothetical protein
MKSWQVVGIAGLVASSLAGWSSIGQALNVPFVDQRSAGQEQQIQYGVNSGTLTPREASRLEAEQQRIRDTKAQMRSDGRLDQNEKAIIDQMQNQADRHISREQRDGQAAYPRYGQHDRQAAYPRYGQYDRHYQRKDPGFQRRVAERHRWQREHDRRDWR